MRIVGKAVEESSGAAGDRVDDTARGDNRAERGVAAGDSLPYEDHVRRNAPVFDGERSSGAAHAGHDFVSDQQDAVAMADFGDALDVAFGRGDRTERGADHGFENKCGDVFRTVAGEGAIEFVGAIDVTFRIFQAEGTAVAIARRDVAPLGKHGRERFAAADVAGNGEGAEGAAVVALQAREYAESFGLAALDPILAGELQRGFGGFRAAGSEIDAAVFMHLARGESQNAFGKIFGDGGLELRGVDVGKARSLRGHRVCNFRDTVADGDDGGAAGRVEIALALGGVDETTLAADGSGIGFEKISRENGFVRHGPPGDQEPSRDRISRDGRKVE